MEPDQLQSAWNDFDAPTKSPGDIRAMIDENKHPVLKGIRKQMTIEIMGWSVFLLCYYTMFDGDKKPVFINLILIGSVLCSLLHNLSGYRINKFLVKGNNIRESLEHYLSGVKTFAAISVLSRVLYISGLLVFFTYGLRFTANKYLLIAVALVIFIIQLLILSNIWRKRLKTLRDAVKSFLQ